MSKRRLKIVHRMLKLLEHRTCKMMKTNIELTLKDAGRGGGAKSARWPGDHLPFLTGSYCGHKTSSLYPLTSQLEGSKVIFSLS